MDNISVGKRVFYVLSFYSQFAEVWNQCSFCAKRVWNRAFCGFLCWYL